MSDVDEGRRMLAEFRAAMQPSARDRVRVASGLAARSRSAWKRGLVVRCTLAAIAAACLLAFALQWLDGSQRVGADEPRHDGAAVDEVAPPVHGDAATVERAPSASTIAAPPPAPTIAAPAPIQRATPRDERATEPRPATPTETVVDGVRAEAALVDNARRALDAGDHDRVLVLVAEHAREFPGGTLAIEARALRALALCLAGRHKQGRGEALVFLREHEDAPYRERIRTSCGLDDGP